MSFIRYGEDPEYFGNTGGYVYIQSGKETFNIGIRDPVFFAELSMRMLAQSDELDDETLRECQEAFAERLRIQRELVE